MIKVELKPEPTEFELTVRQPGNDWLNQSGYYSLAKLPPKVEPPPYWTKCNRQLHRLYGGICAYFGYWFHEDSGATTTDHFFPKSSKPNKIYEWSNYRLACKGANSKKHVKDMIIDPFDINDGDFQLELITGVVSADPSLQVDKYNKISFTIDPLGLDLNRLSLINYRADMWQKFLNADVSVRYLIERSPFIYKEAFRQGKIKP